MAADPKILRPGWGLAGFVALVGLGCGVGAIHLLRTGGFGWMALFYMAMALGSVAGVWEQARTRLELRRDELLYSVGWRRRRIAKDRIEKVTWAKGCGVLIQVEGKWVELPSVGNSQAVTNSVRAWLKRSA